MKIVFLSRVLYLSGVTTHMRDLAKELIAQGHSVTILTAGPQFENSTGMDVLMDSLKGVGVHLHYINYPVKGNKWEYFKSLLKSAFSTYNYIKKERFDVIHVHTPILSFIPKFFLLKFVTTIHVARLKLGVFQQKPTFEIAISKEVYKECLAKGMDQEHISLIYNGVDKKYALPISVEEKILIKNKQGIPLNKIILGFVGTLCPRKGLDLLLKACTSLYETGKSQFHIVLLGNYDRESDNKWLSDVVRETGSENFLSIIGYKSPELFYKIFDIFVLPSRLEGFPLVTIEAMLSGGCCVRSNVEGAYDQIDDGKTGFLFENENVEQLSSILKFLIENPDRRTEVAKAGREKALKEFTSEVMAKKTIDVYKKVINEY